VRVFDVAMETAAIDVAELAESAVLRQLLAAVLAGARRARVAVAFRCGPAVATAAADRDAEPEQWAVPLGCLAKLLTATLARAAVAERHFGFDCGAAELLGSDAEPLRGVTLRHLLEHTHGLDDSLLGPPRYRCGFVDRGELLGRVRALRRWAPPGATYSYGHLGAWLVAAVLERVHARAYEVLVRDELLAPLAVAGAWSVKEGSALCAATGAGLALTAEELVRVGSCALAAGAPPWPQDDRPSGDPPITPLPGWNPLERGIYLGWKSAAGGWLGHQSAWPGASIYVRVQPQRGLALAVASRDHPAAVVAARIFGTRLAELFELRVPQAGNRSSSADLQWPGVYEHAAHVVTVEATPTGLYARAHARDERGAPRGKPTSVALGPAGDGVFFAQPSSELLPYVQFVPLRDGAAALWNGRWVLRRSA
jgi:CubicO group peptidase (beta-lactamase class C family)